MVVILEQPKKVAKWRFILPKLLAHITGEPRYLPDIEWSRNSWVHNIFRFYEIIFWAPALVGEKTGVITAKITPQISSAVIWRKGKIIESAYQAHSFEGACALIETWIRGLIRFKITIPIKIWIPKLSSSNGLPVPSLNYIFAIAFDAAGGRAFAVATNSLTYAHTITGSNRMIVTGVKTSTTDDVTSVVYNSSSAAQVGKVQQTSARWTYMYYQLAPSTGTNNNVISTSDSPDFIIAKSTSYTGVKQSSQPDASATNTCDGVTTCVKAVTTVADNCWVVGYGTATNAVSAGTGVTDRHSDNTPEVLGDSNAPKTPAGSYSMTFDSLLSSSFALVVASFAPVIVTTTTSTTTSTSTTSSTSSTSSTTSTSSSTSSSTSTSSSSSSSTSSTTTAVPYVIAQGEIDDWKPMGELYDSKPSADLGRNWRNPR